MEETIVWPLCPCCLGGSGSSASASSGSESASSASSASSGSESASASASGSSGTGTGAGGIDTDCCEGVPVPSVLTATLTGNGVCNCIDGEVILEYSPALSELEHTWVGTFNRCSGGTTTLTLICIFTATPEGGSWSWQIQGAGGCVFDATPFSTLVSCDPFYLVATSVTVSCCGNTFDIVITI